MVLFQRRGAGPATAPPRPPGPAPAPAEVPEGVQQIGKMVDSAMPMIEQITGLTRREIFLQLMKTGFKGGNLETFFNGLMGQQQPRDPKFVQVVKTLAIWGPLAIFLIGLALASLYLYVKLLVHIMGAL